MEKFCSSLFQYTKRHSTTVEVGDVKIGSDYPIVIQSMGTVSSNDIQGATQQALSIAKSGAQLVRFTAQGTIEAENMGLIKERMRAQGCTTPLVADIHFNPKAAYVAASCVEKVRINPGNFIDKKSIEIYSNDLYESELKRLDDAFHHLIDLCKEHRTAIRIGVNHGSLSDRIVSRYGDTIEGMVESAMEFLRVARNHDFNNIVVSLKSSNTQVMVRAYRLLCSVMLKENFTFPLHLGVTEAGDDVQGRIRSAVGIGALLGDGIGDTIRVSLTEKPENEVLFAKKLLSYIEDVISKERQEMTISGLDDFYNPFETTHASIPDLIRNLTSYTTVHYRLIVENKIHWQGETIVVDETSFHRTRAVLLWLRKERRSEKIVIRRHYSLEKEMFLAVLGVDLGALLIDGFADALWVTNDQLSDHEVETILLDLLQATRRRVSSPEYISCPGCGRTLYDLQQVLSQVKQKTKGIKNIKIAVMGCIVNGPGEMADADYGYVGASRGKVTLYKKGEIYKKNIDQERALDELIELLRENNEFI